MRKIIKNRIFQYGFSGVIKLFYYLICTKLFFPKSRLIRQPFDVRGKKYIDFGTALTTGRGCRIEAYPHNKKDKVIFFGNNVELNDYVHITAMKKVSIGNNVLMASKIYISDCTHGFYSENTKHSHPGIPPNEREYSIKPVEIKNNVWIGESVSILPGVTIGAGSIIGANSLVNRNIPDNVIAGGIPAKPIKKFNFETNKWEKV